MDNKVQHGEITCQPTDAAELKRLENIYQAISDNCKEAYQALQGVQPILDGVEYRGVIGFVQPDATLAFKGVFCCPHCCERAVMFLRDTANTIEDMLKAIKK